MEIFAEMANNGIKVIMTTHSDFMFNELTNLILGDKIKPEQVASVHLVMTEKGSIDKGDMKATAEGIDDFNFSEVTEQLYEERMRLMDLKNEAADVVSEN
jgi:predicted ATPase